MLDVRCWMFQLCLIPLLAPSRNSRKALQLQIRNLPLHASRITHHAFFVFDSLTRRKRSRILPSVTQSTPSRHTRVFGWMTNLRNCKYELANCYRASRVSPRPEVHGQAQAPHCPLGDGGWHRRVNRLRGVGVVGGASSMMMPSWWTVHYSPSYVAVSTRMNMRYVRGALCALRLKKLFN